MTNQTAPAQVAEPLLEFDKRAKALFEPHGHTAPVKALKIIGQAGDQLQLRLLCGGVFALGLARGDPRMIGAAARMIVAHELATFTKGTIKGRIDRTRPRSTTTHKAAKPRKGRSRHKEQQSFPSGHSAGSVAVAVAFAGAYPQHRALALTAAGSVALAQIPTCAHYPSDVAAGSAIGAASGSAVNGLWRVLARMLLPAR